jgi:hypothetical protein
MHVQAALSVILSVSKMLAEPPKTSGTGNQLITGSLESLGDEEDDESNQAPAPAKKMLNEATYHGNKCMAHYYQLRTQIDLSKVSHGQCGSVLTDAAGRVE